MTEVRLIETKKLQVGEYALRTEGEDETLADLVASIVRIGVVCPLLVVKKGDSFSVVSGHRRLAAAKIAGVLSLPCMVQEDNEGSAREVALAENIFRKDLSPVELAAGIKDILGGRALDLDQVADAMNRSRHWVVAQVNMLVWPVDVLDAIQGNVLSVAAASNLALITDDSYRSFLLHNAAENGATARITAAWLQAWRAASAT